MLISSIDLNFTMLKYRTNLLLAILFIVFFVFFTNTVHAQIQFDLNSTKLTPFPSNLFSVPDERQLTGRRISLPMPDCKTQVSDCRIRKLLNQLDGFNVQPRLSIPFTVPIDVNSINSESVFLIKLDSKKNATNINCQFIDSVWDCDDIIGINQMVWNPDTNTLHVESDKQLLQHSTYGLVVTNGVTTVMGEAISTTNFKQFQRDLKLSSKFKQYRQSLKSALHVVTAVTGLDQEKIVALSVFTTQSVTAAMEKMRDQIQKLESQTASFNLGSNGERSVFSMADFQSIVVNSQVKKDSNAVDAFNVVEITKSMTNSFGFNVNRIGINFGKLSSIAYGRFQANDYREINFVDKIITIPEVATKDGVPKVQRVNDLYFTLLIPEGVKPVSGWPVTIFGGGSGSNKDIFPYYLNSVEMLENGIAVISINAAGHGDGPLSSLEFHHIDGTITTLLSGGRNIDINGDGIYDEDEDVFNSTSFAVLQYRDLMRQSVIELMQLTQLIKEGIDVNNDGFPDLDGQRINYLGISQGGLIGTTLLALEPNIQAGVINVGAASIISLGRLSVANRSILDFQMYLAKPSLVNIPAKLDSYCSLPGLDNLCETFFDENLPLRNEPIRVNDVKGAIAIQDYIDKLEWLHQNGSPESFAPYIRKIPLDNGKPRNVIFQLALGDQNVDNLSSAAVLRAGELAEQATLYRHDRVYANPKYNPGGDPIGNLSHGFLSFTFQGSLSPLSEIGFQAQKQITTFFSSDGQTTIDPDGANGVIFEMLNSGNLPTNCSYIALPINFKPCQ